MQDLLNSELTAFLNEDLRAWLDMARSAIDPLAREFGHLLDMPMLAAFLVGALAMLTGARLALLGAALMLMGLALVQTGVLPDLPDWVAPTALVLLGLGAAQGLLTIFFGEQTAGALLVAAVVGVILFVVWRGPARALRLLGLVFLRKGGR